jgi:hypothetical protein
VDQPSSRAKEILTDEVREAAGDEAAAKAADRMQSGAVVIGMALGMTTDVEKPAPEAEAALEEEGVADPEAALTELLDDETEVSRRRSRRRASAPRRRAEADPGSERGARLTSPTPGMSQSARLRELEGGGWSEAVHRGVSAAPARCRRRRTRLVRRVEVDDGQATRPGHDGAPGALAR